MDEKRDRNLLQGIAALRGKAYETAFDKGRSQFNTEQERHSDNKN